MSAEVGTHEWIMEQAERFKALGSTAPRPARDPINQAMINNWVEAIGDDNPVYRPSAEADAIHGGVVAPTAMSQVWTMGGLNAVRSPDDPLHGMMAKMDEAGFTSVLGTNCDQTYDRYVKVGEQVTVTTHLDAVVGPKVTGVGEGYFVTTKSIWRVGDEQVATMLFRVLKFKPRSAKPKGNIIRPVINRDNEFFFEGTAAGELRLQNCDACGELRHPPGPMCPSCHAASRSYIVSPGAGTIFSYVVHYAPQIPGKTLPLVMAIVALDEGVRMVGELKGVAADDASDALIGKRVALVFDKVADDLTLAAWQLDGGDQ
jgi:hypothetical protein